MDDDLKNNLSTIAVLCYAVLSPYIAQYLTADQFSALFVAIIGVVLVLYSAKYPNTFEVLGNGKCEDCSCGTEEIILNEEYTVDPTDDDGGA